MNTRASPVHYLALYGNFDRLIKANQPIPESYFDYLETQKTEGKKIMKTFSAKKSFSANKNQTQQKETVKLDKPVLTVEGINFANDVKGKLESFIFQSRNEQEKLAKKLEQILGYLANDSIVEIVEKLNIIENRIDGIFCMLEKPITQTKETPPQTKEKENQGDSPYQKFLGLYGKDFDKNHFAEFYSALDKVKNPTQETLDNAFKATWANNKKLASPRSFADLKPAMFSLFLDSNTEETKEDKKPVGKKDWAKLLGIPQENVAEILDAIKNQFDSFSSEEQEQIFEFILEVNEHANEENIDLFLDYCETLFLES